MPSPYDPQSSMLPLSMQQLMSLYEKKAKIEEEPIDNSAALKYARERGQGADMAMLGALAAAQAGDQFKSFSPVFLKQAISAQEPLKMGNAYFTPQGDVIRDPEADKLARIKSLNSRIDKMSSMIDADRRHQEMMGIRKEMLNISRDRAGQTSYEFAGTGPDGLPVVLNKKTGALTTPGGQPVAGPITPKGGDKTSESERTAAGYLTRMRAAENILSSLPLESQSPGYIERGAQYLPGEMGRDAANLTRGSLRGMSYQAQQDWVRAKLRKESGAVIGAQEMNDEIRTYFPMPGDGPEVIAQKAASRKQAERQFEIGAGHAVKEASKTSSDPLGLRK